MLWIYGTEYEDVFVEGNTQVYRRTDMHDLDFHRCVTCGNTICWRIAHPKPGENPMIAVNLRLADQPERVMDFPIRHFDGLVSFKETTGAAETVRDIWY